MDIVVAVGVVERGVEHKGIAVGVAVDMVELGVEDRGVAVGVAVDVAERGMEDRAVAVGFAVDVAELDAEDRGVAVDVAGDIDIDTVGVVVAVVAAVVGAVFVVVVADCAPERRVSLNNSHALVLFLHPYAQHRHSCRSQDTYKQAQSWSWLLSAEENKYI